MNEKSNQKRLEFHRYKKELIDKEKDTNVSPWKPIQYWPNSTIYILGGGPSLNKVNFDLIKDKIVIATNNAYGDPIRNKQGTLIRYEPREWIDALFFLDSGWWRGHKFWLKNFKGKIFTCHPAGKNFLNVNWLNKGKHTGISIDGRLSANRSSGAAAINLAYYFGAKKVVLLGFDMRRIDGMSNWHSDHANPTQSNIYKKFLISFPSIKQDAEKLGLEIYNATPDSAIKMFPFVDLEEFVKDEFNNFTSY